MKNIKRVLAVFLVAAITFFAFATSAKATAKNKAENKPDIQAIFCKFAPFLCSPLKRGGNGDGEEPPRPKKK